MWYELIQLSGTFEFVVNYRIKQEIECGIASELIELLDVWHQV